MARQSPADGKAWSGVSNDQGCAGPGATPGTISAGGPGTGGTRAAPAAPDGT